MVWEKIISIRCKIKHELSKKRCNYKNLLKIPEYVTFFEEEYPHFNISDDLLTIVHLIYHDLDTLPVCSHSKCKNPVKVHSVKTRVGTFCSKKCSAAYNNETGKIHDILSRGKKTNLERFGVENGGWAKETQEKIKQTNIERFGVENPFQSEEIKQKIKQTNLERFGVENPFQSEEIKQKIKNTNRYKYGVDNPTYRHLEPEAVKCLNDIEFLQSALKVKTVNELANELGVWDTTIYDKIELYNLTYSRSYAVSSQELQLRTILKENNIDFIGCDRSMGIEFDILIPSAGLAIEINGNYYHSEKFKSNDYHQRKYNIAAENGYQLFSIYEDEFIKTPDLWVNKILYECKKLQIKRIYARKCQVVQLTSTESNQFLEENHIQGKTNYSSFYYGLKHCDDLVAVMVFGNSRNNEIKSIELKRFCSDKNVQIIGGASKLLAAFKLDTDYEKVISFSNNRYSSGKIYETLGFVHEHDVLPDYEYIHKNSCLVRHHKSNFRKSRLITKFDLPDDIKLSEKQIMLDKGYYRLYDCGKKKWSLSLT
jgi:hypothetical protein